MTLFGIELVWFCVLILLSAFFSSSEVAYTGLTRGQLKRVRKINPDALKLWESSPDRVLATLLLSNNAVNTAVGVLSASVAIHLTASYGMRQSLSTLLVGLGSGAIILFFGEIIPKIWAKQYTLSWALRVTPIMRRGWRRHTHPGFLQ